VLRDIPERLRVAPMRLLVQGVAGHKDVEAVGLQKVGTLAA
jgi:hypothetical protein